ncbi:hypothetical protein Tco_1285986 [Tanacetum coccineum]
MQGGPCVACWGFWRFCEDAGRRSESQCGLLWVRGVTWSGNGTWGWKRHHSVSGGWAIRMGMGLGHLGCRSRGGCCGRGWGYSGVRFGVWGCVRRCGVVGVDCGCGSGLGVVGRVVSGMWRVVLRFGGLGWLVVAVGLGGVGAVVVWLLGVGVSVVRVVF